MVTVKMRSETATGREPAVVEVYDGETLVRKVGASIDWQRGADGGLYPVVHLAVID